MFKLYFLLATEFLARHINNWSKNFIKMELKKMEVFLFDYFIFRRTITFIDSELQ